MDPRKQGQPVESNSQVSHQAPYQPVIPNQNLNSQVTQFQSSPLSQQAKSQGMSKNKIVFGVVGALIAIVLLVFLLGQKIQIRLVWRRAISSRGLIQVRHRTSLLKVTLVMTITLQVFVLNL